MGKLSEDILPESNGRSKVLKANYFWFQNIIKQLIKSLEEKNINNHKYLSHTCTYRFFDSLILEYIFSIKMMETILDQLESCRYDDCVQK